jgi:hypothetical protein
MAALVVGPDPIGGSLKRIRIAHRGIVAFSTEPATLQTISEQIALRGTILREIEMVRLCLRRSGAADGVYATKSRCRRTLRSKRRSPYRAV